MNKLKGLSILNNILNNISIDNQTVENAIWMLEHLEENNQPDSISIDEKNSIKFTFIHSESKTTEEIDIDKREIYYSCIPNNKTPYFKRYFILPRGGIGDKEIFMLNKEMEYLRKSR